MNTRVHKVFSGFAGAADQAMLGGGTQLYNQTTGAINLADRQLGLFNAETLASIATTAISGLTVPVFLAMGYDSNGDGTVDSVVKSLTIDPSKLVKTDRQAYVAGVDLMKTVTWTTTDCDTEYCIKANINSVLISEDMGFNPLYKTFSVTTDCCVDGCDTCGGGDCDALADLLVTAINDDKDGFLVATKNTQNDISLAAEPINTWTPAAVSNFTYGGQTFAFTQGDYTGDAAGDATELQTELQAFLDANNLGGTVTVTRVGAGNYTVSIAGTYASAATFDVSGLDTAGTVVATTNGCPSISVIASAHALANFCHLPVNLVKATGVTFDLYGDCAFDCNFTEATNRALVMEEGNPIVVKDMEEEASGYGVDHWYRYTSLVKPDPIRTLLTDVTKNYNIYFIEHQDLHEGAPSGHFFRSTWQTIIAVPTDYTTLDGNVTTLVA